jgi:hypothetical protein
MLFVRIGISKLLFGLMAAGRRLKGANGAAAAARVLLGGQRPQRARKRNGDARPCVIKARKRRNSGPHGT